MTVKTNLSRLPNGVRVASCEMPHTQTVAMGIWTEVGGRYESVKLSGISHFIEHLLFKGTSKRTARQISQAVEGVGGYLNAFTTEEHTCYHGASAAEYSKKVFDVLADMYLDPRFAATDIERERNVIVEEILMYRDDPSSCVQELLGETVWSNHALGRPLTGSIESVKRLQRADFLDFRSRYYQGRSTLVTFAGKITHTEAEDRARVFEGLAKGRKGRFISAPSIKAGQRIRVVSRDIEQTHLAMAFPAFSAHDDRRYALCVLDVLMGGNSSSRLFQEMREKRGLCYSVNTFVSQFADCGIFNISCGLDVNNLERSIDIIFRECERLKSQPITKAELRRAKDYILGTGKIASERSSTQNSRIAHSVLRFDKIISTEWNEKRFLEVTIDQIQQIAKRVFDFSKLSVAVVGPIKEAAVKKIIRKHC